MWSSPLVPSTLHLVRSLLASEDAATGQAECDGCSSVDVGMNVEKGKGGE